LATNDASTVPVALRVAASPASVLHPAAVTVAGPKLQVSSCHILGRFGRTDAASALLALLDSPHTEVRAAAHHALLRLTNQRISDSGLSSSNTQRRDRVVGAWRAFYDKEKGEDWLQWLRLGFEARGVRFRGKMQSPDGVERPPLPLWRQSCITA